MDLPWQKEDFELVTSFSRENSNELHISVIMPSSGPSSNVGLSARSGEEVLEWLSGNKGQFAFCFPPELLGPDILCFVQSKNSGCLLLIAIQAKQHSKVDNQDLIHGVRTVTPSWFWKSKDKKVCSFLQTI